jgi:hypothetical protein
VIIWSGLQTTKGYFDNYRQLVKKLQATNWISWIIYLYWGMIINPLVRISILIMFGFRKRWDDRSPCTLFWPRYILSGVVTYHPAINGTSDLGTYERWDSIPMGKTSPSYPELFYMIQIYIYICNHILFALFLYSIQPSIHLIPHILWIHMWL